MSPAGAIKRATALTLIALSISASVPRVFAHRHHVSKSPRLGNANNTSTLPCDLDADLRPDLLILHANGNQRTISISLGGARNSLISFAAETNVAANLITRDIDHDGDVDLVWVNTADRQRAVVLINNGQGNFVEATDNSLYASELDGLFGAVDPSGNLKLKRGRKGSTLSSASFHELGLPVFIRNQRLTISQAIHWIDRPIPQSFFACYLPKRGPPVVLS